MTGQPDFATVTVRYVPAASIVELKSLKLYLWSYRSEGVFHTRTSPIASSTTWSPPSPLAGSR